MGPPVFNEDMGASALGGLLAAEHASLLLHETCLFHKGLSVKVTLFFGRFSIQGAALVLKVNGISIKLISWSVLNSSLLFWLGRSSLGAFFLGKVYLKALQSSHKNCPDRRKPVKLVSEYALIYARETQFSLSETSSKT